MSDTRTSPAPQARYAASAVLELRGVSKVYGSGAAEVHALPAPARRRQRHLLDQPWPGQPSFVELPVIR
jgi:hypothetical protein